MDDAVMDDAVMDDAVTSEVVEPGGQRPSERVVERVVEAVLMVADQPVEPALLGELAGVSADAADAAAARLSASYREEVRGFELVRVAGGWRFQSAGDLAAVVERFALQGQVARLSAAALETLAIVAYRQPISRAQISLIRGVNVDGVVRTLAQRGYIAEIGTDSGPGQALLYGTTQRFLEGLGIDSLADLPSLGDFVPGAEIMEALEAGLSVETSRPGRAGPSVDGADEARS